MSYRNYSIPILHRLKWLTLFSLLPFAITPSMAAPGPLSQVPLFSSSVVEPNIMFLIDNSGSMNNIVPDVPYDPQTTYFECPSAIEVSSSATSNNAGSQVDVRIQSNGNPFFRNGSGTDFDWGITSGNGLTGRTKQCFNPNASYTARLHASSSSSPQIPGNYLAAQYTGNYLNWYFGCSASPCTNNGNQAVNFGSGARLKPDTETRMAIAQEAAKGLVNSLTGVRAGLCSYDGATGARINVGIDDLDNNINTIISKIDALSPSGSTPLAESLHEIGRYFVGFAGTSNPGNQTSTNITSNGQYDGSLILHPGGDNEISKNDGIVFNRTPALDSGVSAESPILYWCQKNFAVLLTDGRPQSDQDITSDTGLTDYDGDCADINCNSYDRKPDREYESAGSDYLDDVALALFEMDLRPDIDDFDNNEVINNVVTYTIGFADDQVINDPLMQDTALNGGGQFLTAANASALQQAFTTALEDIYKQTGSSAAVTFNSGNLDQDSVLYLALFNSARWSGQILALPLDENTGDVIDTPLWDAAVVLDNTAPSQRTIITSDGSDGIPFQWANLTVPQKADLCTGPETDGCTIADPNNTPDDPSDDTITGTETTAQARLAYIRGDDTNEIQNGGGFRDRDSRLGDIVHSGPVFVGKPSLGWPDKAPFPTADGETYTDFRIAQESRTPVLYAGANDGMLHGFRASDGVEVLAYIPNNLFSASPNEGLHFLTDPDYFHLFYVDLKPTISDVYVNLGLGNAWHTILIGGQGAGGRGYFALDITDPSQFSENNADDIVLWEFTSDDDPDLGHTFSPPSVVLMENGRWAAIFGNGFEDSGSGEAQLFIVYLDGGLDGEWTLSNPVDYVKISTGVGDANNRNGLATPAVVDTNGDGVADRAYAGDLRGNMWAFDLSGDNDQNWNMDYKLFTGASNQAVTSKPAIARHPNRTTTSSNEPNLMVLFGTGQFIVNSDKTSTDTQTFYGVWDQGTTLDIDDLVEQTIDTEFDNDPNDDIRVLTDNTVDFNTQFGWFFDLPDPSDPNAPSERVVADPVVREDIVFFNTITPSDVPCGFGGSGWLMSLDIANGGLPDFAPFDVDGNDIIDENDLIEPDNSDPSVEPVPAVGQKITTGMPAESAFLDNKQYTPDSGTESGDEVDKRTVMDPEDELEGRLSWEELLSQ